MGKHPYEHLISPLKVGNRVIKNRMESSNSTPHFLQGPEPYPAEGLMRHYLNRAKSGAAIVTVTGINSNLGLPSDLPATVDVAHFPEFDMESPTCENYLVQLTEGLHFYGALASVGVFSAGGLFPVHTADGKLIYVSSMPAPLAGPGPEDPGAPGPDAPAPGQDAPGAEGDAGLSMGDLLTDAVSAETLDLIAESFAQQAEQVARLGFDMVTLHMAYRAQIMGQAFSPITNQRTDEFGGSFEGRARFPLMVLERIHERVGRRLLVELQFSLEEEGGYPREEGMAFLRLAEPYVDIVQVRCGDVDENHPTGYNLEHQPFLELAAYVKSFGLDFAVGSIGGNFYPDEAEAALAAGKLDLVAMARSWISNPNYGRLVYEGRGEDIVPCLRCNKCHGRGPLDVMATVCSVNPVVGLEHHIDAMVDAPARRKRVAVIGGGPAGLRCAMDLSDRGHEVVLFEASEQLGGAICHADYVDFKWPLRDFKNYLVRQVYQRGVEVRLGCAATPEQVAAEGFDAVVAAVGATPVLPPVPGLAEVPHVFYKDALERTETLGQRVAIIGGGEVGVEIGIHAARCGHDATVLEMRGQLAADSTVMHYRSMFQKAWEAEERFRGITGARVTGADGHAVSYVAADGSEQQVPYDTLVIAAGMAPRVDEALAFQGCAPEFHLIGDCSRVATVQQAMRSAYGVAAQI